MTHNHYAGMGMCAQWNPGWHLIPDPSNAIVVCDDCGHLHGEHSREPGVGCLHRVVNRRLCRMLDLDDADGICPCLQAGSSGADQ